MKKVLMLALSGGMLIAPGVQAQCDAQNQYPLTNDVHQDYKLHTIRPDSFQPQVAGLEIMPNGDLLVLTWRGESGPMVSVQQFGTDMTKTGNRPKKGDLFLVSGAQGTDRSAITVKKIAGDFKDAQGLVVVNGEIYVGDIDRIVKLTEKDANGVYQGKQEIGKLPAYDGWFEYAFGPVHKAGRLYMALAVNVHISGNIRPQWGPDRSTVVSMPITGGAYDVIASGLRAPDGIGIGPDNEVFITDNQGGWRPTSPIIHIRQGRHYGYTLEPAAKFQSQPTTIPSVWLPYRDINDSPTEPYLMPNGTYRGQMFFGDIGRGGLYRSFMEKVLDPKTGQEEFQGAVFFFSAGFEAAIHRIRINEKGEIYLGELGNGGASNQGWRCRKFGLQKLVPNATSSAFEMLAVRSRKKGMEIEFTKPVGDVKASNFFVEQWTYKYVTGYGQGMQPRLPLTAKAVQVSPDKKKVFIEIDGIKEGDGGYVVHIKANGLKAEDGSELKKLFDETWYTVRAISNSEPFTTVNIATHEKAISENFRARFVSNGSLQISVPKEANGSVALTDLAGRVAFEQSVKGGETLVLPKETMASGIHFVRLMAEGRVFSQRIAK